MCRETHPLLFIVHYLFSTDSLVLSFTVIYQYWCCHIHTSEHGITFAIHKLRTEFTRQFVCRNGHGSQYKFAKEKVLGGFS